MAAAAPRNLEDSVTINATFTDELTRTIDQLKHDKVYKRLNHLASPQSARVQMEQGYYERWLTRLEILLVEDGVLAPGELDAAVAAVEEQATGGHRTWDEESGARPWATRYG